MTLPPMTCDDATCNSDPPRFIHHSDNSTFVDTKMHSIYVDNLVAECFRAFADSYHDDGCYPTDMREICKITCQKSENKN